MEQLFQNFLKPDKIYTPFPFWFWNDQLEHNEIIRQIYDFHAHGIDGFVIHPRMGLPKEIEYLSDLFLDYIETAVKTASVLDMQVILYDEGMYPSGSAHGMVAAQSPEFSSQGLKRISKQSGLSLPVTGKVVWSNASEIFIQLPSKGHIRGIHAGEDDRQADAPASADLLNIKATQAFIHLTHERYYGRFSQYFGTTIVGMFTDEPNILGRGYEKGLIPWSDGLLEEYIHAGGKPEDLPLLWKTDSPEYQRYQTVVHARLETAFYRPISEWCSRHGIALTGHPAESDDIGLLKSFHIPGQDLVLRMVGPEGESGITGKHSTQAKCSADSARHRGKRRNSNECFGACNLDQVPWNFTADDMKWYMDWLFIRGVNLLIPHAFYYSIRGERAMERPPDVGPNNLWWSSWHEISSYIKRMSYLLTDSVNTAHVAVLCHSGSLPWQSVKPLFEQQIEFNYLEESLLDQCQAENGCIKIMNQQYNILLADTLPFHPVIEQFLQQGGKIKKTNERFDYPSTDVRLEQPQKKLRFSHIIKDGLHLYLFSNEGEETIDTAAVLNVCGYCELWDPWKGESLPCPFTLEEGNLKVRLFLPRRTLLIYAIQPDRLPQSSNCAKLMEKECFQLCGTWRLNGKLQKKLISWTKMQGFENYSGSMTYETEFFWHTVGDKTELELTEVYDTASVKINGKDAGTCLWAPFIFDITGLLRAGHNHLEIKVCNSMANQMSHARKISGFLGKARCRTYQAERSI